MGSGGRNREKRDPKEKYHIAKNVPNVCVSFLKRLAEVTIQDNLTLWGRDDR